jgi:hypothetical protein
MYQFLFSYFCSDSYIFDFFNISLPFEAIDDIGPSPSGSVVFTSVYGILIFIFDKLLAALNLIFLGASLESGVPSYSSQN